MENKEKVGFFDNLGATIRGELERRKNDKGELLFDIVIFTVSFLFSRCHIVFGAYPLAISLIAVLNKGVWIALIGGVAGSLTLGSLGIIQSIIAVVVVFLRVIISGGGRQGEPSLFEEPLILKIASAAIGAFIGAAYEILLGNFSLKSIIYGASAVVLSSLFTFAFAGILDYKISFSEFLFGRKNILIKPKDEKERMAKYLFEATFLLFIFLVSISLREYVAFGISLSYIFASFITLIVAKRFGAIRGMTVGFVSSFGVSSVYSVAFALVGLGSGMLFGVGISYAVTLGGVLLSVWSAYAEGAVGFLSTFPEYVTATILILPFIKKIPSLSISAGEEKEKSKNASDMVSTTALLWKSNAMMNFENLSASLQGIEKPLRMLSAGETLLSESEYRDNVIESVSSFCRSCYNYKACVSENPAPCAENIDLIATKLYKKERISANDINITPKYCHNAAALFEAISRESAKLEEERYKGRKIESLIEEYSLFSKLISEVRAYNEREYRLNVALSEKLTEIMVNNGLEDGVAKVFGDRKKHFVLAGEDADGSLISSRLLREQIAECSGTKLGACEYYRRGDTALLECSAVPMFKADFACMVKCLSGESVSGDVATSFESADGHFYSLIADGMGSGDRANKTAEFVSDFLSSMLNSPCSKSTVLHILNSIIRGRREECSSTIDLFDFDLMNGEAVFYKCGAAPSYIKRDNSIFRIRSETCPLGLMKSIDAERVRVEIKSGDYIIMLSDGIMQASEESTWLVELLGRQVRGDIRDFADEILSAAVKNSGEIDDMSVAVIKIAEI